MYNGAFALSVIREDYLGNQYTSAYIKHMQYGRIEIRAALPKAKNMRTAIIMVPDPVIKGFPDDGQIDIFVNEQDKNIKSFIHYNDGGHKFFGTTYNRARISMTSTRMP